MNFLKRKPILISTILLGFISILWAVNFVIQKPWVELAVVSKIPPDQTTGVPLDTELKIQFNKKVSPKDVVLTINPDVKFGQVKEENNALIFQAQDSFLPDTTYAVSLTLNENKKVLAQWSFKTTKDTFDPKLSENLKKIEKEDYPLQAAFPVVTNDFYIKTYLGPKKIEVALVGEDTPQKRNLVYQWVQSKGVDPKTHEFVFLVRKTPLGAYLPYETARFKISYQPVNDLYVVNIFYDPTKNTTVDDQVAQTKQEVFTWVTGKGVNPQNLNFDFRLK